MATCEYKQGPGSCLPGTVTGEEVTNPGVILCLGNSDLWIGEGEMLMEGRKMKKQEWVTPGPRVKEKN